MVEGRRVVVAVSPRLLADALCRSLAEDGLLATVAEDVLNDGEEFDVAVVSAGREALWRATHVVTIPDQPDGQVELAALRRTLAGLTQRSGG